MIRILLLFVVLTLLTACGGTGTDTENVIFPEMGVLKVEVQQNRNLSLTQVSATSGDFCQTLDMGLQCYIMDETGVESYSGTVLQGILKDSTGAPLGNAKMQITPCEFSNSNQKGYSLETDANGEFVFGSATENCFHIEAVFEKEGTVLAVAFVKSVSFELQESKEATLTSPISVKGTVDLQKDFGPEQKFVIGVSGLSGSDRRVLVQNGDSFQFYNIPKDVDNLYFFPISESAALSDKELVNEDTIEIILESSSIETYRPVNVPIDKTQLDELKEIRVEFRDVSE